MKFVAIVFCLIVLISVICSFVLLSRGIPGWGWFLFAAIVFAGMFSYTEED